MKKKKKLGRPKGSKNKKQKKELKTEHLAIIAEQMANLAMQFSYDSNKFVENLMPFITYGEDKEK